MPYAVASIKEIDLKINEVLNFDQVDNSFGAKLVAWFGNVENGIQSIFAKEVHTDKLCVGETCVTEEQLIELLGNQNNSNSNAEPIVGETVEENTDNNEDLEEDVIIEEEIQEEVITEQTQEEPVEPEIIN